MALCHLGYNGSEGRMLYPLAVLCNDSNPKLNSYQIPLQTTFYWRLEWLYKAIKHWAIYWKTISHWTKIFHSPVFRPSGKCSEQCNRGQGDPQLARQKSLWTCKVESISLNFVLKIKKQDSSTCLFPSQHKGPVLFLSYSSSWCFCLYFSRQYLLVLSTLAQGIFSLQKSWNCRPTKIKAASELPEQC